MSIRLFLRRRPAFNFLGALRCSQSSQYSDKPDKSKTLKEKEPKPENKKNTEAINKLNTLLNSLITTEPYKKIELAKPKQKRKSTQVKDEKKPETHEEKINKATEDVANLFKDSKNVHSELLNKLLQSDPRKKPIDMSKLFSEIKVEQSETPTRADQVRKILSERRTNVRDVTKFKTKIFEKPSQRMKPERVDLMSGKPLNIFKKTEEMAPTINLDTWTYLQNRELRLAVTHPPSNYFQQMILWTEQGKLWKFPIDNEQGLEAEQNVYFAEHIFLEHHIDEWCPKHGPIRHYMELVCVGLSKNHWYSAADKKAHLDWYKNYFAQKADLLKDVGALPAELK